MQLQDQRVLRPDFLILVDFSKIFELVHHALLGSLEWIFVLPISHPISFSALSAPLRALSWSDFFQFLALHTNFRATHSLPQEFWSNEHYLWLLFRSKSFAQFHPWDSTGGPSQTTQSTFRALLAPVFAHSLPKSFSQVQSASFASLTLSDLLPRLTCLFLLRVTQTF